MGLYGEDRQTTTTIVKNKVSMRISISNQNIIKSINQVTNDVSTNIDQIVKATTSNNTTASNTSITRAGEISGIINVDQNATANAKNSSAQKVVTDAAAFQQFTTSLQGQLTNKLANDAKMKQDADILNTFKEKSEKQEGIFSVVNKIVDGISGIFKQGGSTTEMNTVAETIFNQEMTINNLNSAELSNIITNVVKTNLTQTAVASCMSNTTATNLDVIEAGKINPDAIINKKQVASASALNSCIQDLNLGSKVSTELVGKTNFEALQEIDSKASADQKASAKNEFTKETKVTDALADVFSSLFGALGMILPIIVLAVVGVGIIVFLVVILPMLKGSPSPPPDQYGGYTDTFIDSITSIGNNLVAGGQDGHFDIANIYFICIFVIIFLVVKKYVPEC